MAMNKKEQAQYDLVSRIAEKAIQQRDNALERYYTAAREVEILCDRYKLTDEQRDALRREAKQGESNGNTH